MKIPTIALSSEQRVHAILDQNPDITAHFPAPQGCSGNWDNNDWLAFVDAKGYYTTDGDTFPLSSMTHIFLNARFGHEDTAAILADKARTENVLTQVESEIELHERNSTSSDTDLYRLRHVAGQLNAYAQLSFPTPFYYRSNQIIEVQKAFQDNPDTEFKSLKIQVSTDNAKTNYLTISEDELQAIHDLLGNS